MACDALHFEKHQNVLFWVNVAGWLFFFRVSYKRRILFILKIDFFSLLKLFILFIELPNFEMIIFNKPTNFQQQSKCSCPIINLEVPQTKWREII